MPSTAKTLGVNDPYNPVSKCRGGVKHLKWLLSKYNGNIILALAAIMQGSEQLINTTEFLLMQKPKTTLKRFYSNYLS